MSLLSQDEIAELTDCKRPSDQIEWLRERHWKIEIGVTGRPKVDRSEYERHMIGGQHEEPKKGPDTHWYGSPKNQTQKSA